MTISSGRLATFLLAAVCTLIALHLGLQALAVFGGYETVLLDLINRFNLDYEASVPTWFAQILLLIAAAIAWVLASSEQNRRFAWQWRLVALLFLAMSIDEGASFHETIGVVLGQLLGFELNLGFMIIRDWVLLASIALVVLAVFSVSFFAKLPLATRLWLIAGGAVFVSGAMLWETLHFTTFNFGHEDITYASRVSVAIEESLEMLGATLIIYALADYARRKKINFTLRFAK